jgi:hypothetical protein
MPAAANDNRIELKMFKITREWVHQYGIGEEVAPNGLKRAGWTAKQLKTIGVPWPPKKGWLTAKLDTYITDEQRQEFENLHHQRKIQLATSRLLDFDSWQE